MTGSDTGTMVDEGHGIMELELLAMLEELLTLTGGLLLSPVVGLVMLLMLLVLDWSDSGGVGNVSLKEVVEDEVLGPLTIFGMVIAAPKVEKKQYKTGVINDPLGQPTVPAGSDCRLISKFWDGRTDGRTLCVKLVITTSRDCGRPRGSIFLMIFNS